MHNEMLIEAEILTGGRLKLFSLYVDFAAAVRARWATSQVARLAGEHWKASSEMWNLDSVAASEPIRKMIAQEAAAADVLVIAMSSMERRELELVQWLDSLAGGKTTRTAAGLFIGLLGDENDRTGELDWTVKQFLRCAQRTDRDFIWRWMEPGAIVAGDWLADSVESLLTRKQPAHDAAFLQETVIGEA